MSERTEWPTPQELEAMGWRLRESGLLADWLQQPIVAVPTEYAETEDTLDPETLEVLRAIEAWHRLPLWRKTLQWLSRGANHERG